MKIEPFLFRLYFKCLQSQVLNILLKFLTILKLPVFIIKLNLPMTDTTNRFGPSFIRVLGESGKGIRCCLGVKMAINGSSASLRSKMVMMNAMKIHIEHAHLLCTVDPFGSCAN